MRIHRLSVFVLFSVTAMAQSTPEKQNKPSQQVQSPETKTSATRAKEAREPEPTSCVALPVKRVVLYKNGVGYFEHTGRVRGSQDLGIEFTTAQLNAGFTEDRIRSDLEQLSKITKRVRTYTVDRGLDRVPYIAKDLGMKVSLGIWLSDDLPKNDIEIEKGIQAANDNPTVIDRVFVGNEPVLRGELTPDQVSAYIVRVRKGVTNRRIEIGTADVAGTWDSTWGFVTLHTAPVKGKKVLAVTGSYVSGKDLKAVIASGTFDPATGVLEFA